MQFDPLSHQIIGCAIEVHRHLGPGLLESAYQHCLAYELRQAGLDVQVEIPLPVEYKSVQIDCAYRVDLIVNNSVILELKAAERLLPIHEAQLLTYMKLTNIGIGLLINFNVTRLKEGMRRFVL